jgi:hypothetical protein
MLAVFREASQAKSAVSVCLEAPADFASLAGFLEATSEPAPAPEVWLGRQVSDHSALVTVPARYQMRKAPD